MEILASASIDQSADVTILLVTGIGLVVAVWLFAGLIKLLHD